MRNNGVVIATFYYDGKNRQIARNLNGTIRFSVWDGWELIEEYRDARTTAYLQGANGVIKSWTYNSVIYYYQDKLGSTTHIANASGALLESYRYDLWGNPSYFNASNTSISASGYGIVDLYAGERWVSELGLYDLRNRFMSAELGRFLQVDPIGFKGDASNLYRYCHNDPENFTDPMGLAAQENGAGRDFAPSLRDWTWDRASWFDSANNRQGTYAEHTRIMDALSMSWQRKDDAADGVKKYGKSMHERSIQMLADETKRGHISQTGAVIDGPPYRSKIVDEQLEYVDRNNMQRGKKDIGIERLVIPGPSHQKVHIVHYHARVGKYGTPTQEHDLKMVNKFGTMYMTDKAWAAHGKYQILRRGEPPDILFDRRIVP